MNSAQLKEKLASGALNAYSDIYTDIDMQTKRYIDAIDAFSALYGERDNICLFSVPGRSEIAGNHTDHNHGLCLGTAVECDIIAVVSPNESSVIRLQSEGHGANLVHLDRIDSPIESDAFSSNALIAGVCAGLKKDGYAITGFDAYTTSRVLRGSGLSSSAAFEVMIGNIENHLANGGRIPNDKIAKIAKYAENVYYGKPCGLLDQLACAMGGLLYMDFEDPDEPVTEPVPFPLASEGFVLCIVNTGGSHASLSGEYAAIPAEMKAVASYFGRDVLRGISESQIIENAGILRRACGDRAVMRALHFTRECERVREMTAALRCGDTDRFLSLVKESGNSSFKYLQNVYVNGEVKNQGLSLALAISESALRGIRCAYRVHGGGFSGTIQLHLPREVADEYAGIIDSVFGSGAAMVMKIRPRGAIEIVL